MSDVPILSTGDPSTLATYIGLASLTFGEDSAATKFLIAKAESEDDGVDAVVLADETQMFVLLSELHFKGKRGET